jgi:riboflavin synthase alpha subunit
VIIPHTLRRTTLGALDIGAEVTIEIDLLARYVARQLAFADAPSFEKKLRDGGFL